MKKITYAENSQNYFELDGHLTKKEVDKLLFPVKSHFIYHRTLDKDKVIYNKVIYSKDI